MQKLQKLYRSNYAGENIVTALTMTHTDWTPTIEYVPSSITNVHVSTQAVAIGNGISRKDFELKHIANHSGGLLAANKFQSYGCNALYRDFAPDFLIAVGDAIVKEIAESSYAGIVYANSDALLQYPGKFHLIPQDIHYDAGAVAAYAAAFDGFKKVFLLGYDGYDTNDHINNLYVNTPGYPTSTQKQNGEFFARSLSYVASVYNDVEFVRVMPNKYYTQHQLFGPLPNIRQIDYREFINEADIG
jgi:hypothetical protein